MAKKSTNMNSKSTDFLMKSILYCFKSIRIQQFPQTIQKSPAHSQKIWLSKNKMIFTQSIKRNLLKIHQASQKEKNLRKRMIIVFVRMKKDKNFNLPKRNNQTQIISWKNLWKKSKKCKK
jgi:hypothetical protein